MLPSYVTSCRTAEGSKNSKKTQITFSDFFISLNRLNTFHNHGNNARLYIVLDSEVNMFVLLAEKRVICGHS